MSVRKHLEHVANTISRGRATGRTTALARAAKDIGGVLVTHNYDACKRVADEHKVPVVTVSANMDRLYMPVILDHYTMERLLYSGVDEIKRLEDEIKEMQKKINELTISSNDTDLAIVQRLNETMKDAEKVRS